MYKNYISYTSVNIQAQSCFVTLHILAEKNKIHYWKWELHDVLRMILFNVS